MIHGATLLLLIYKLPYILHDPRNGATLLLIKTNYLISYMIHGATLLLLKCKLPYILHDPRSYLTPIKIQITLYLTWSTELPYSYWNTNYLISYMIHGATLLLLKCKLPYILHDPRATLLLLKYKLPYILHDPRSYLTPIKMQTTLYLTWSTKLPYSY
jgi:uncharacterized protein YhhL (DUF1145 family)